MSGIGGGDVGTSVNNPFAPIQTTTDFFPIPPQTSTFDPFINPATTPTSTPTPSQSPLTISKIVTKTLPSPSSSDKLTPTFTGTTDNRNNNNNNNSNKINTNTNTISTAAIIFSIMIGFIIVGGCIALILARTGSKKKKPIIIEQRDLFGDEANMNEPITVYSQINSISPPLNLPPPPPQRSPPSSPRLSSPQRSQLSSSRRSTHSPPPSPRRSLPSSPRDSQSSPPPSPRRSLPSLPIPLSLPVPPLLPPIPQHTPIVLYRNPSLMRHGSSRKTSRNHYDPVRLDPNYPYQKYSQLSSQSAHNAKEQTNIDEPP